MNYQWLPTSCTPINYPVKIFNSVFVLQNGDKIKLPESSIIHNGWGQLGSIHLVGEELQPIPTKLDITWFSFVENKFYAGSFDLPKDKITEYFDKGFKNIGNNSTDKFEYIVVGTSPGGGVSVWIKGGLQTIEIEHFQAKEIEYDWNKFSNEAPISKTEFIQLSINDVMNPQQFSIAKSKINPLLWSNNYRKTYDISINIVSLANFRFSQMFYCNGATEYIIADDKKSNKRTLPISIIMECDGNNRKGLEITFDEAEITKAYDILNVVGDSIIIQPEINSLTFDTELFIKNSKNIIQLNKCIIQKF